MINASASFLDITGNTVSLVIPPSSRLEAAVAHRSANYLVTKTTSVLNAWTINPSLTNYLYIDIDRASGSRTYGVTHVRPVYQTTSPSHIEDLHWFDVPNTVMRVSRSGTWSERIRIFVGAVTASQKLSPVTWSAAGSFIGTQVGINEPSNIAPIVYDDTGRPVLRASGTFLTSSDSLTTGGSQPINAEALIVRGMAKENLSANRIVSVENDGTIKLAAYGDVGSRTLGFIVEPVSIGDVATVFVSGVIKDVSWSFPTINQHLYVGPAGTLTPSDPHMSDPLAHPNRRPPVARVLDSMSVIFSMNGISVVEETNNPTFERDETLFGVKTFDRSPVVPTVHPGDMSQRVVNAQWAQNRISSLAQNINGGAF